MKQNRLVQPGDMYGLLTVIEPVDKVKGKPTRSVCRCICGRESIVTNTNLIRGNTKSCGCVSRQLGTVENMEMKLKVEKLAEQAVFGINVDEDELWNPLNIPEFMTEEPHIYLSYILANPKYFSFICKELMNVDLLPIQALVLQELWIRKFPMLVATRGFSKSYLLGLYSLLRMALMPGRKVIVTGAAFRQSKIIFEYAETIWNGAPLLRDVCTSSDGVTRQQDLWKLDMNGGRMLAMPVGVGDKIRGQRAHDICTDEFSSVNREIFENVISGFGAVTASPIINVHNDVKDKIYELAGIRLDRKDDGYKPNQTILSGTAYYEFNHFYEYWKKWRDIIWTRGDKRKLQQLLGGDYDENFDWRDYSIIRIPHTLVPPGFLDVKQIARSRATVHSGNFQVEYCAVFSKDSAGFFRRSLIEGCVANHKNVHSGHPLVTESFDPLLMGYPDREYVLGIDPASEIDNFSIVVLELHEDHRRIVYVWKTNKKVHKRELKEGDTKEKNYFAYCARKIRELMKKFNVVNIALDSQGGGHSVMECLKDEDKMKKGETAILPIFNEKFEEEDFEEGRHIVHLINFASSEWTSTSNHGMKKDFEDRVLQFPNFDSLSLGLAYEIQGLTEDNDGLEVCLDEIEELKNELSTIVMTSTPTGRDRFDLPSIKLPGGKTTVEHKDRYSALLMANAVARDLMRSSGPLQMESAGGIAGPSKGKQEALFVGDHWYNKAAEHAYSVYD